MELENRRVDDEPYGGGPGMLFRLSRLFKPLKKENHSTKKKISKFVLFCSLPRETFQQAEELSACDECLLLICGRYEGFDERIRDYVDEEISEEISSALWGVIAMVFIEAISRLRGNILGNQESAEQDTFSQNGILEYPQYTRPST